MVIEKWKYGYVFIGNFVNEKTINYIGKYMLKDDLNNREFTGKVLTSAGMGKQNFVNEKTINYISKYMLKDDLNNREFTGKVLTSPIVTGKTILRKRRLEI